MTGDINVGRDPSNVNVWGNMTLTGIVDLTGGADPDETLLVRVPLPVTLHYQSPPGQCTLTQLLSQRQGAMVHLDGGEFVNGTLLNASRANATLARAGGGLRRLEDVQESITVTLRRLQGSSPDATNASCVQSQISLQNG